MTATVHRFPEQGAAGRADVLAALRRARRTLAPPTEPAEDGAAARSRDLPQDLTRWADALDEALAAFSARAPGQVVRACADVLAAGARDAGPETILSGDARDAVDRALAAVTAVLEDPDVFSSSSRAGPTLAPPDPSIAVLFAPYRSLRHLAGAQRVHPAELWSGVPVGVAIPADPRVEPRSCDVVAVAELEAALLRSLRQPDAHAFGPLSDLCAALGQADSGLAAIVWRLAGAVFEAQREHLLEPDLYLKRLGSQLLALARAAAAAPADSEIAPASAAQERLAALSHELWFFGVHAAWPAAGGPAPRLAALREALAAPMVTRVAPQGSAALRPSPEVADETPVPGVTPETNDGQPEMPHALHPPGVDLPPSLDVSQENAGPPPVFLHPPGGPGRATPGPWGRSTENAGPPPVFLHPPGGSGRATPGPWGPFSGSAGALDGRADGPRSLLEAVPGLPSWEDLELSAPVPPQASLAVGSEDAALTARRAHPDEVTGWADDAVKVIGPLRIEIERFNRFLVEADELSRQLGVALGEWSVAADAPLAEEVVGYAQALAVESAAVGHADLSGLCAALARALGRSAASGPFDSREAALFLGAHEEVSRLLHQFAAGFLKSADEPWLQALQGLDHGQGESAAPPAALAPLKRQADAARQRMGQALSTLRAQALQDSSLLELQALQSVDREVQTLSALFDDLCARWPEGRA